MVVLVFIFERVQWRWALNGRLAHGYARPHQLAKLREAARAPRARSHCRFRNRGTDYVSEPGMKRTSSSTKRQCDRARRAPPVDPHGLEYMAGRAAAVAPRRGRQSHSDAAVHILYGESLREYTGWRQNGFNAQG
jgi:hypothetical protein